MTARSKTVPEPKRDIAAQLRALADPAHPKKAVFIEGVTNLLGLGDIPLPEGIFVAHLPDAIFITRDYSLFQWINGLDEVSDEDLARMLGYPEPKSQIANVGTGIVIQARDDGDNVVFEAGCSDAGLHATLAAVRAQVPIGGRLVMTDIVSVLKRRVTEV